MDGAIEPPRTSNKSSYLESFLKLLMSFSLRLGFSFSSSKLCTPVAIIWVLNVPLVTPSVTLGAAL